MCFIRKTKFMYLLLLFFSSFAFAQTINITNSPNYTISGNSTITNPSNPDCGKIDFSSPWLSSNFNVSSNNSLVIHSTMSYRTIYGSVNFPFTSSSV
ncbi:MAG: hypothetical protein LBD57_00625, partial [Endomicrobium sp.]|uniref:hypothetical protein n=1 Tax=Candidatus Endomicrobiellum cubanum TaxID=3242325 RepID=UPI002838CFD2|nr:hypothetical protein [Endomicrobium sp.]